MNYARLEAAYPQLDLLSLSARRLANLTLEWLMGVIDPEEWNARYKELFFGDPELLERRREAAERIKPAGEDGRGGLTLKRAETPGDAAELGIAIGGKPVAKDGGVGPVITPGEDGEMTIE